MVKLEVVEPITLDEFAAMLSDSYPMEDDSFAVLPNAFGKPVSYFAQPDLCGYTHVEDGTPEMALVSIRAEFDDGQDMGTIFYVENLKGKQDLLETAICGIEEHLV